MEWNVLYFNSNARQITTYNIFGHGSFDKYFKQLFKKCASKEEFAKQLRSELMYYYWSKSEWELIIELTEDNRIVLMPWCSREPEKYMLDVTSDTSFDWQGFAKKQIQKQIYHNRAKIDVFSQIEYYWDDFVNYCWSFKKG